MSTRFYNTQDIDLERLAHDLESILQAKGYQTQQFGTDDQKVVQLRKGGDFERLLGLQAALAVVIQRTAGGISVTTGQQQWAEKAVVGVAGMAIPPLWPLLFTAGIGAVRQAALSNEVLWIVDGLIRQQQPGVQSWPPAPGFGFPGWQPPQPPPAPSGAGPQSPSSPVEPAQ
ncbi:hypothetical protein [Thermogemmatispora onikobensis]|uniref:hypothetical protein n=1 Tax=Thermogemmatispora onikobensis TaxID=732234 RepID=UPI000853E9BA|nr:hypothetical protein [Thermogemmatispora onikobensis]